VTIELQPVAPGEPPRTELVGIGAALALEDGAIVLGPLAPDGGAARAGLTPGDQILAIDDRPVQTLGGLAAAVQRIRGAEGTQVLLHIRRRDGKQADILVTRALIRF
jgi:C-terminal processing protease CtpA/Prc